jgi:hypothetical protein
VLAAGKPAPIDYAQDGRTGDFLPDADSAPWLSGGRRHGSSCSPG